jgi:hypothetical protein
MKIKLLIIISCFALFNIECKKNSHSKDESIPKLISSGNLRTTDFEDLADSLMNQYGLVILTSEQTSGIQFPTYDNYAEASAYIENVLYNLGLGLPPSKIRPNSSTNSPFFI